MARFSALADSCEMGIRVRYSILEALEELGQNVIFTLHSTKMA